MLKSGSRKTRSKTLGSSHTLTFDWNQWHKTNIQHTHMFGWLYFVTQPAAHCNLQLLLFGAWSNHRWIVISAFNFREKSAGRTATVCVTPSYTCKSLLFKETRRHFWAKYPTSGQSRLTRKPLCVNCGHRHPKRHRKVPITLSEESADQSLYISRGVPVQHKFRQSKILRYPS
jgi:hypothetical protein